MTGLNGHRRDLSTALGGDDLREAVRAVLRDVLPDVLASGARPAGVAAADGHGPAEVVDLRSDADLQALVRRVAALCEDPAQRAALRDGRRTFRLAATGSGARTGVPPARQTAGEAAGDGVVRVDRGAVTERVVDRAAKSGARLVMGPRAVLTPLARDRARRLGVAIDRLSTDDGRGR